MEQDFLKKIYVLVTLVFGVWLLAFSWFMATINQNHVKTFFSTQTGRQQTIHLFRSSETDELKAMIFKRTIKLWGPIVGEVKVWLTENLAKWEVEKPPFYTKRFVDRIPREVLSPEEIARLIKRGKKATPLTLQQQHRKVLARSSGKKRTTGASRSGRLGKSLKI